MEWCYDRASQAGWSTSIVTPSPEVLRWASGRYPTSYMKNPQQQVLTEILKAGEHYNADLIVEVTGDCPFIDPKDIQRAVADSIQMGCGVCFINVPHGFRFRTAWVKKIREFSNYLDKIQEHGTWGMYEVMVPYRHRTLPFDTRPHVPINFSVDTWTDYDRAFQISELIGPTWGRQEIIAKWLVEKMDADKD